eukprot:gene25747-11410_t
MQRVPKESMLWCQTYLRRCRSAVELPPRLLLGRGAPKGGADPRVPGVLDSRSPPTHSRRSIAARSSGSVISSVRNPHVIRTADSDLKLVHLTGSAVNAKAPLVYLSDGTSSSATQSAVSTGSTSDADLSSSSAPSECKITLLGESFGGALALRVVLKVPQRRSTTAQATLLPLLLDSERVGPEGVRLMKNMIDMEPAMGSTLGMLAQANGNIFSGLPGLPALPLHSPAAAANFRVNLLRSADLSNTQLKSIKLPTLILCSAKDRLLPSIEEGARLAKAIPGSKRVILPDSGHAAMLEKELDMSALLKKAGFSPTMRSSIEVKAAPKPPPLKKRDNPIPVSAGGGYAHDSWDPLVQQLGAWRDLVSPLVLGTENLPSEGHPDFDRPMLFVGNHGKMGFYDTPLLMYELYIRGFKIRPIAHPGHWAPPNPFGPFIESLGGVKASPLAAFRLLKNNEKVLLFPGGAREVCKTKDQSYQLLWKETPDFVRMATKCNALIIPFAAVGADDAYDVMMETEEQLDNPILGPIIQQMLRQMDSPFDPKQSVFPITRIPGLGLPFVIPVPNLTRLYFKFGKPVDGQALGIDINNAEQCQDLYEDIKGSVNSQIQELLELRQSDDQVDVRSRLQRFGSQFLPLWEEGRRTNA